MDNIIKANRFDEVAKMFKLTDEHLALPGIANVVNYIALGGELDDGADGYIGMNAERIKQQFGMCKLTSDDGAEIADIVGAIFFYKKVSGGETDGKE